MTTDNLKNSTIWNASKRILYAMQVIIVTLAVPALSYMEVSHTGKDLNTPVKIISKVVAVKPDALAYNLTIK